jgi:hypothetical protein
MPTVPALLVVETHDVMAFVLLPSCRHRSARVDHGGTRSPCSRACNGCHGSSARCPGPRVRRHHFSKRHVEEPRFWIYGCAACSSAVLPLCNPCINAIAVKSGPCFICFPAPHIRNRVIHGFVGGPQVRRAFPAAFLLHVPRRRGLCGPGTPRVHVRLGRCVLFSPC